MFVGVWRSDQNCVVVPAGSWITFLPVHLWFPGSAGRDVLLWERDSLKRRPQRVSRIGLGEQTPSTTAKSQIVLQPPPKLGVGGGEVACSKHMIT